MKHFESDRKVMSYTLYARNMIRCESRSYILEDVYNKVMTLFLYHNNQLTSKKRVNCHSSTKPTKNTKTTKQNKTKQINKQLQDNTYLA